MPDPVSRRISALDWLVIVLALAAGTAWVATAWPLLFHLVASGLDAGRMGIGPYQEEEWSPARMVPEWQQGWTPRALLVKESFHAAAALLAPLTVAVVALRLRRPRPRARHLFRQPGAAGCAAASVVLLIEIASGITNVIDRFDLERSLGRCQSNLFSMVVQFPRSPAFGAIGRTVCSLGEHPGLAVGGVYFALAVSGLRRRGSDPIERLARGLAAFWLVAALVFIGLPGW